jgi:Complex1_LYR-like
MKFTPRLWMATPTSAGTANAFRPAPLALLPPIPLYRRLLRAHRKHLPREMRLLGDEYVKSEFRAHRNVENPVHIVRPTRIRSWPRWTLLTTPQIGFLTEWQMYAQKLEGDSWIGERMDIGKIDKMSGTVLPLPPIRHP